MTEATVSSSGKPSKILFGIITGQSAALPLHFDIGF
jgi:hypothetical protein